jgi:alpha-1,2-mannosyltransferase
MTSRQDAARSQWRERVPQLPTAVWHLVGAGVGIACVLWAVTIYWPKWDTPVAAYDLDVFLRAASAMLDGDSPYVYNADQTYAYPPLLAFLVAPLEPLSAGAATAVWTLVLLASIAGALLLLGVRDWRCLALTLVYPVTQSAVELGTVGPLLLLGAAAAWRWRGRVLVPAAALGAAVALKLFLWPLAVWLAVTGRIRAAAAAAGFAVGLVLVPWAALGFTGLDDYPGLLRRLSDEEGWASYSVYALGLRVHLPEAAAIALSVAVVAGLLAAAAWVARDARRTLLERDSASLTLALAAAIASTPIVWVHYFLLLLVPLALSRPRLSALWFLPFAYYPLGETAWPGADARKLALALVVTLLLLGAGLLRRTAGAGGPAARGAASSPLPTGARGVR